MSFNAWILAGATASGKSAVSQIIAERMGAVIISADSMLVYKGMDIGTAKPSLIERGNVAYYGIDLVTPAQCFSTGAWINAAQDALQTIHNEPIIVTGGTGLYIKALTAGLETAEIDPQRRSHWEMVYQRSGIDALLQELKKALPNKSLNNIDQTNPRRIIRALLHLEQSGRLPENWEQNPKPQIIALTMERSLLHQRIQQRVQQMFSMGLIEETRQLKDQYPLWSPTAMEAIGYREALGVLEGTLNTEQAQERICARTRQLAKRQETWLRHQFSTIWCVVTENDSLESVAEKVLNFWHEYGKNEIKINNNNA